MLKNMRRRCVSEGEDGDNESKLSEPSMSKAGREMTDITKKAFIMTFTWPWGLHGLEMKLLCSFVQCLQEESNNALLLISATYQIKQLITFNDFWIHKEDSVKILRRK
jgi:hypothetical protein